MTNPLWFLQVTIDGRPSSVRDFRVTGRNRFEIDLPPGCNIFIDPSISVPTEVYNVTQEVEEEEQEEALLTSTTAESYTSQIETVTEGGIEVTESGGVEEEVVTEGGEEEEVTHAPVTEEVTEEAEDEVVTEGAEDKVVTEGEEPIENEVTIKGGGEKPPDIDGDGHPDTTEAGKETTTTGGDGIPGTTEVGKRSTTTGGDGIPDATKLVKESTTTGADGIPDATEVGEESPTTAKSRGNMVAGVLYYLQLLVTVQVTVVLLINTI